MRSIEILLTCFIWVKVVIPPNIPKSCNPIIIRRYQIICRRVNISTSTNINNALLGFKIVRWCVVVKRSKNGGIIIVYNAAYYAGMQVMQGMQVSLFWCDCFMQVILINFLLQKVWVHVLFDKQNKTHACCLTIKHATKIIFFGGLCL